MLDANLGEILTTLEKLRWVIAEGEEILSPQRRSTGPTAKHKLVAVEYDPLGVIGAIAPWNYPLHNLFNPVISALFAGNSVVVKPSEHTAYSSLYFARVLRRALSLCGHSPEVVQVLIGGPEVGAALVDGDIDKLFFTGSTAVGRQVAEAAAKRLLPVELELGGKDPCIICEDADIGQAADTCLRGVFQNSGQNCIGIERVFVHTKVKEPVVERFVEAAESIRPGLDIGAVTMGAPAVARIQELVDDAVAKGASVLVGGKAAKGEGVYRGGHFFQATVLDNVTSDMRIAQEEVFGPVLTIMEWTSNLEVIAKVNDCKFGLGASIFTRSMRRANRIAGGLRVGMININDFGINYMCQSLPFGGTKESGSGRFAGVEGLRGCCLMKTVTRDRFGWLKTRLPRNFKYPVSDNAFELSAEITDLLYNVYGLGRFDNVRNLIGLTLSRTFRPRSIGNY
jgi:acyl-CoA reductase-like NAD-dependent aldehyde dehydrogenase